MSLNAALPGDRDFASVIAGYLRETRAQVNNLENTLVATSIPGLHTFDNADTTPLVTGKVSCVTNNPGATTIAYFDGGYEGQLIVVVAGDANTTIQYDPANIQLTTQANVKLAQGEAIAFVLRDNVWREIGGRRRFSSKEVSAENYTMLITDRILLCNAGIQQITITFPSAASAFNDVEYIIKKLDGTANKVIANGIELTLQNEVVRFVTDGANWIQV